jgi:hypothetical protein
VTFCQVLTFQKEPHLCCAFFPILFQNLKYSGINSFVLNLYRKPAFYFLKLTIFVFDINASGRRDELIITSLRKNIFTKIEARKKFPHEEEGKKTT